MKAFEFDKHLTHHHEIFKIFHHIRAEVLKKIDDEYDAGRFWPDALLSLNPRYLSGKSVAELVEEKVLDSGRPFFSLMANHSDSTATKRSDRSS